MECLSLFFDYNSKEYKRIYNKLKKDKKLLEIYKERGNILAEITAELQEVFEKTASNLYCIFLPNEESKKICEENTKKVIRMKLQEIYQKEVPEEITKIFYRDFYDYFLDAELKK